MFKGDSVIIPRKTGTGAGDSSIEGPILTCANKGLRSERCRPRARGCLTSLMIVLCGILSLPCLASTTDDAAPSFRLPDGARPTRYSLDLTVDPRSPAFHGVATIEIELKRATRVIWLNQKSLTIRRVAVSKMGGSYRPAVWETREEFLMVRSPFAIGPGKVDLRVDYDAMLNDKSSVGAYRKKSGNDWYVYTSFTPIDARRAFPCFDEPGYKAPWAVTLHIKREDVAVANGPDASSTDEADGMKRVAFKETQPLASEVVAFAVGPFDIEDAGVAGEKRIPVRIITPRGRMADAAAARAATAELLPREEAYTGIAYPWDKLDHIAVLDLPFGATENPGLITYRDSDFLVSPAKDTPRRVAMLRKTMAHEMAHQWFGNLVTQAWWDDTWLSEGFATWMAAKVTNADLPENAQGLAMVQARDQMMRLDAKGKRPVRLEMRTREQTDDVYDLVVYQKGAATLKMVEDWVGEGPFRVAIRRYLQEHAMGNATTAELERTIEEKTGVKVTPVMDGMLNRVGYPLIRFRLADAKLLVDQEPVGGGTPWVVPICIHLENAKRRCELLDTARVEIPVEGAQDDGPRHRHAWIWTNAYGSGYYRSVLDEEMLDEVLDRGYSELSEAERLSLLVDIKAVTQPDH
jgi:cytosol alanyl aminopeptidase